MDLQMRVRRWLRTAWRRVRRGWNAVRAFFYGRDVFVSYSHHDRAYAELLAGTLQPRRRTFLDLDASRAEERSPRPVLWHARHCRVLVVVATSNAFGSREVMKELRLARGSVVAIVDAAMLDPGRWTHPVWRRVHAATPEVEDFAKGTVDAKVVKRIGRIVGLWRWNVRVGVTATAALILVIAAGGLSIWFSREAARTARQAQANRLAMQSFDSLDTKHHWEA